MRPPMLDLLLVRHASTALNEARRYQGRVDPPLTPAGQRRARALGGELAERLAAIGRVRVDEAVARAERGSAARGERAPANGNVERTGEPTEAVDHVPRPRVYTSDRRRARRTAALALPDVAATREPRLRELDFGEFDGATYAENLRRHGDRFRAWIADPAAVRPPGGESLPELEARVLEWLREQPSGGTVVAFTHGGPIRVLLSRARGVPLHHADAAAPAPGEIVHLSLHREMA